MSYPVYTVPAGDTLPVFFATYDGGTGASVTLTGLAVTDIEIYKDGGVTQRASDAGYTLLDTDGIDFDGVTGIHGFSIDTSDNTDAGFYTVGAWFHVVVSSVTVDAQTVNFIACAFRIVAAEDVAGVPDVNTTHIGGTAQTANDVGADVDAILVDTGTTLQAELDGIQADTEDIQSRIPTALVGGRIDATIDATGFEDAAVDKIWDEAKSGHVAAGSFGEEVQSHATPTEVGSELTSYDAPTHAELISEINSVQTDIAALNDFDPATETVDVGKISGDTTAADRFEAAMDGVVTASVNDASATTTSFVTDLTEATNDHYKGRLITFTSGALLGQQTDITAYNGTTKAITCTALTEAPANGTTFVIH